MKKLITAVLGVAFMTGCSGINQMTTEDIQKLDEITKIVERFGPRAEVTLRTGRPFIAGMVEGFILVPGTELDVEVSADSARQGADE